MHAVAGLLLILPLCHVAPCLCLLLSSSCILAELYTGYPLFPGENETEQLQVIMEILGVPPKRLVAECTRKKAFFDPQGKPLVVPNSRGKIRTPGAKDLAMVTKCTDQAFLSFLRRSDNTTRRRVRKWGMHRRGGGCMLCFAHRPQPCLCPQCCFLSTDVCVCMFGTGVFAGIPKCA